MMNFSLMNNGRQSFQNALAMGMQMGAQARQAREEREYKNALAQFDPSNPETLKPIMAARPEVGLQLRGQVQAQQQEARLNELTQRALSGDPGALDELASVNFDRWKSVSTEQRTAAAEETKMFGQVALSLSQIPYGQRRDQILALAQQMPQYADKIQEIAFLPQAEQDNILRVAITEAGLIERLIQYNRPDYQPLGPDQVFVDVNNPAAVAQFSANGQAAAPSVADIEAELRRRGVLR